MIHRLPEIRERAERGEAIEPEAVLWLIGEYNRQANESFLMWEDYHRVGAEVERWKAIAKAAIYAEREMAEFFEKRAERHAAEWQAGAA